MRYLTLLILLLTARSFAQAPAPVQIHNLPTTPGITGNGQEWLPLDQNICSGCTFKVSPQQLATYILAQPFAINASSITTGTLPCAQLPSFSGAFTSNGCSTALSGIVPVANGGTGTNNGISITSPDGSLGVIGSPSAALTLTVNASNIAVGTVPLTVLPALTGNNVQLVAGPQTGNISNMCGTPFVDGFNGMDKNFILLGHQTDPTENGPWQMHTGTCPGSGQWNRPIWFQSGSTTQAVNNMTVTVNQGTLYGGTTWSLQFAPSLVIIDTTAQSWFVSTPVSAALNGGTIGRTAGARASDEAVALDYATASVPWSGTIRKDYGNSGTIASMTCVQTSNLVTLAGVTIPSNYTSVEIPGCGNPGMVNSANPGSQAQSWLFSAPGTGYVPKMILNVQDGSGTSIVPAQAIVYSTIVAQQPTITSGGTGCTDGTDTFQGTTGNPGSGVYLTVTGTVSGGVFQSIASWVPNGPYYENPINLLAEPVSGNGCVTQPTINLSNSMGAYSGSMFSAGNYSAIPSSPVSATPAALPVSAMTWNSGGGGTVAVTICRYTPGCASTLPGWMYPGWVTGTSTFTVAIAGVTPSAYNGTYQGVSVGPNGFNFPLASNPGVVTQQGTYTISPNATGAQWNPFWYGNPLVATISNIVNAGGSSTFNTSVAANSTLMMGGGYVYLWHGVDNAAITAAASTAAVAPIRLKAPVPVPGFEAGYMLSAGVSLGGAYRKSFDCEGGFISGAVNAGAPVSGGMLTINNSPVFRAQQGSYMMGCDLDAAGGFQRNLTNADWDWSIGTGMVFRNPTVENIGWSFGGHSRESRLFNFQVINDGYNPLTFPVLGIDSQAPDTRIDGASIMQGFQQAAIYNASSTGDVNVSDVHGEQVVGGCTFAELGAGNRWLGGNQADVPAPGFCGWAFYSGFNTIVVNDVIISGWVGQIGLLFDSGAAHSTIMGNTPNRGGIPGTYACVDQTTGTTNSWIGNIGCNGQIFPQGTFNIKNISGAGTATQYVCADSNGNLLLQSGPC